MGIFRLYTGLDGESHVEALPADEAGSAGAARALGPIEFLEDTPGTFFDWHPAPRRQWVIILSGQLEIGFGDGTQRRFGPGDARLVEDLTGRGHTTRVVGDVPCVVMLVAVERRTGDQ